MTAETAALDLDAFQSREWMSARIGKSEDWIAHNMHRVPHIKIGRDVFFTERLAREFIEAHVQRPNLGRTERSRGARRSR